MTEYDSYSNYESSVLKAKASQTSFSIGIKIPKVFELGYNSNDMRFKKFMRKMKRFSSSVSTAPLNSLLTCSLCVCVGLRLLLRSAVRTGMNQILSPTGFCHLFKSWLSPPCLPLCLQHPGAFPFSSQPGFGMLGL